MSDDEYEIPLQDQRVFGAGLKRKRIHFVPSTTTTSTGASPNPASESTSVADRYLSIVLSRSAVSCPSKSVPSPKPNRNEVGLTDDPSSLPLCEICSLPTASPSTSDPPQPHEASLAHQVCLTHSHPPSHLDRSRIGLRYLQSHGWDPDSRMGLGPQGQGIQFPIKAKTKDDKMGLGLVLPVGKDGKEIEMGTKKGSREKLDAGKVRKLEGRDRRRRQRLQELFYRSEDLDRHLRTG